MSRTWVFLRGLARESRHWSGFDQQFQNEFPGDQVIALDAPGTGQRLAEDSPLTIPDTAESLRQWTVRELGPSKTTEIYLVTISLGSMIGLEWLGHHPDEVKGLVMINPSVKGFSPFYRRFTPAAFRMLFDAVRASSYEEREEAVLSVTSNLPEGERPVQEWADIQKARPMSSFNVLRQLIAGARYHPSRPPTGSTDHILLLSGANDRLVHPSCSLEISNRWGIALQTHPTAGHDLTLDDPDWVIKKIKTWAT